MLKGEELQPPGNPCVRYRLHITIYFNFLWGGGVLAQNIFRHVPSYSYAIDYT